MLTTTITLMLKTASRVYLRDLSRFYIVSRFLVLLKNTWGKPIMLAPWRKDGHVCEVKQGLYRFLQHLKWHAILIFGKDSVRW